MLGLIATQWTTPVAAAARPFILWCDGVDVWPLVEATTVRISDQGGNVPAQLTFDVVDGHGALGPYIKQLMRVLWVETAPNGGAGRILFHGFVKIVQPVLTATWARYKVTCVDLSSMLDEGLPIEAANRGAETDRARIQWALTYCTFSSMGVGGFVQSLASLSSGDVSHGTARSVIEDSLQRTGASPVGYYVDPLGFLHTYAAADNGSAPFNISEVPNYTTTVPAVIEPVYDGSADADLAFVYGGTQAGSGVVGLQAGQVPRFPARYAIVDAPDSIDALTLQGVGVTELANRRGVVLYTITVSPDEAHGTFDGWMDGQALTVTNAILRLGKYLDSVLASSPVTLWKCNESSGQLADSIGAATTTAVAGSPTYSIPHGLSGGSDTAVGFDGSTTDFTTPSANSPNLGDGPLSIEVWVLRSSITSRLEQIVGRGSGGYNVGFNATNQFFFAKQETQQITNESGSTTDAGVWHHFVATYAGGATGKIYKDGVDVTKAINSSQVLTNPATVLEIGNNQDNAWWLTGDLQMLAIYNRALSPDEVRSHYAAAFSTPTTLIIQGVDVTMIDGRGRRTYKLTCGAVPYLRRRLTHLVNHHAKKAAHKRIHAKKIRGHKGPAKNVGH